MERFSEPRVWTFGGGELGGVREERRIGDRGVGDES